MEFVAPSSSLSAPVVHVTYPPSYLFKFPPESLPSTLPPPAKDHSLANPFTIPSDVYNNALSVSVPITIAITYACTVLLLNQLNKKRGYKPWAISESKPFFAFVVLHNVFLALFSAWVFVGMANAVATSWPGWKGEEGLAGAVDALCKINGPRGLGDAATYNSTSSIWQVTNRAIHLGADGLTPDTTDVGRIWNEGLAFYGWLFYLSKFYEVLDTAIILAKGKRSSTLQTYHHAGAMMCMWAGIRYMAPPIWMFVLVNSGIHALMYTYYTLTVLSYRVPIAIKRTLTTLQISQFVVGASFAAAHLFIAYDIPVSVPYIFTMENISSALPAAASTVSSAVASATVPTSLGSYLKKLALRAGGAEGLAENVRNDEGPTFGLDAVHAIQDAKAREEIRYRAGHQMIHCMDTSGQAFAIYLNVIYLLPLTGLFVRFFIKSYTKRSQGGQPSKSRPIVESAGKDAWKGLGREVMDAVVDMHGVDGVDEGKPSTNGKIEGKSANKGKTEPESRPSIEKKEKKKPESSSSEKEKKSDSTETDGKNDKEPKPVSSDGEEEERKPESDSSKEKKEGNSDDYKEEEEQSPSEDKSNEDESSKEPEKASDAVKNETVNGNTEKDAAAYEASPDETMDQDEKKAEAEMQPGKDS